MKTTTQITLDLEVDDDFLSGRVRNGSGPDRPFSGWLGLMAAIDELLAAAGRKEEDDEMDSNSRTRPEGRSR